MGRKTFPIDWRNQFAVLQRFIDGEGGVACVRYVGERCAPNSFVEALTSLFEGRRNDHEPGAANGCSRSLRIDRNNYRVRYLAEIRTEFARKLKLELPNPITDGQFSEAVHISSNNTAGRDQKIETHINYLCDNEVSLQVRRDEWIGSLCNQIKRFLENHSFMVNVMHGSKEDQQEFWDVLWHRGMSGLVDHGLLLVRMIDTSDTLAGEHHQVARPDCEISLPLELNSDQQNHAIEDIANCITRWDPGHGLENARAIATGFVLAHTDDIARLHNKITGLLLTLKQRAALSSI